jgi:hypothetical protein
MRVSCHRRTREESQGEATNMFGNMETLA